MGNRYSLLRHTVSELTSVEVEFGTGGKAFRQIWIGNEIAAKCGGINQACFNQAIWPWLGCTGRLNDGLFETATDFNPISIA